MVSSFKDFFILSLDSSCKNQKYKMTDSVKNYITDFYSEIMLKNVLRKPDPIISNLILFDNLPRTEEVITYLKQNGDYYFFTAGWAPEYLCVKNEDFQKNIEKGLVSYQKLDLTLGSHTLYGEIAVDYEKIIFVLNEAFDLIKIEEKKHILMYLDCWNKTRHQIFKKKLLRAGMQMLDLTD
jgi:hypothetical protein